MSNCQDNPEYPPSPCPSHSTTPPTHSPPGGTAFTGSPDLGVASVVLGLFLLAAVVFGFLGRAFSKDER